MLSTYNEDKGHKTNNKLESFRKNHADMESELRRRLQMLRKKNLRMFLKQIDAI